MSDQTPALPPEPGTVPDPDLGIPDDQVDHDGIAPAEPNSPADVEVNDDDDTEEV